MKRVTTEVWIERARKVHGNLYDYSSSEYKTAKDKVEVRCKAHGSFSQFPSNHVRGQGCPSCVKKKGRKKYSTEDWVSKAVEIHGGAYDYSKTNYKGVFEEVRITCPVHGEFSRVAKEHIEGRGCKRCYSTFPCNTEDWVERAKEVHGDRYSYESTSYKKSKDFVNITCHLHGEFSQRADVHLRGSGCPSCGENYRYDINDFISRCEGVHGNRYNYDKVEYTGRANDVTIVCKEHGDFFQRPFVHLQGSGCPYCAWDKRRFDTEEFIERAKAIHGDRYDYSEADYKDSTQDVKIICAEHGPFYQRASTHLKGTDCFECTDWGQCSDKVYIMGN